MWYEGFYWLLQFVKLVVCTKIVFYISICKSSYSFSANNVVILIYYGEFYNYVFKKNIATEK